MTAAPAFEDIRVESCTCPGCRLRNVPDAACRAAHGRRIAAVATLTGATLLGGAGASFAASSATALAPSASSASAAGLKVKASATAASGNENPQGQPGPLGGRPSLSRMATHDMSLTRQQILARAQTWVDARVPYVWNGYWSDGYRQDCSGFISMAWGLSANHWTGDIHNWGVRISKDALQPGDMLLYHNPANPQKGSHVVLFAGWTDSSHTRYVVMESAGGMGAVKRTIPYAYTSNSAKYVPYRYKNVTTSGGESGNGGQPGGGGSSTAFPGASAFGPGANNAHVTKLGQMLVKRGGGSYYSQGPGPKWSDSDRKATQAFQKAQGWSGADADGIPGKATWSYLVEGKGKSIGGATGGSGGSSASAFPGTKYFRPGVNNDYVTQLGKQLVKKGFGKHYSQGPGPKWSESDRRNVEAFQRSQGWSGADADGYPGPETWKRLFR
ncbi:peptidoglycan-binding protein [Streptomyces celluloflavus]|uniref:peptidoglycan-binding protein n=1 Tax=Streptomyces celluloflavus TaxID=58344 RepID=UPI00369821C0